MDGVLQDVTGALWRRQVVAETGDGVGAAATGVGPDTQQVHEEVASESGWKHLWDDVHVGDEGRLENNGDVGSVEQLDWVSRILATVADGFDGKIHTETYFNLQLVKMLI